jgi:GNAT superfamily N-acetyltransferase
MSTNSQEEPPSSPSIVAATTAGEIEVGVRYRHAMKVELGLPVESLIADWAERETAYFIRRTAEGGAQWYLARDGAAFVGSSCAYIDDSWQAQLHVRPHIGWIIGVYVVPEYRRRGIARSLTTAAVDWLRASGCRRAKLHASPYGREIYVDLGFTSGNEMELGL